MITGIESSKRRQKEYIVTISYIAGDSNGDKDMMLRSSDDTNRQAIYRIEVWATDIADAIRQGIEAITIERAEIMSDFITSHPRYQGQDSFTRSEIEDMYEEAKTMGLFQSWLLVAPTAIQCNLADDEDKLQNLTIDNVLNHAGHIGEQAESFLKEEGNDS